MNAPKNRGMRRSVWIPDRLWEEIKSCAEAEGVSIAAYIREAVTARIFYQQGKLGKNLYEQALDAAKEELDTKSPPSQDDRT